MIKFQNHFHFKCSKCVLVRVCTEHIASVYVCVFACVYVCLPRTERKQIDFVNVRGLVVQFYDSHLSGLYRRYNSDRFTPCYARIPVPPAVKIQWRAHRNYLVNTYVSIICFDKKTLCEVTVINILWSSL